MRSASTPSGRLTISAAAEALGTTVDTIRYYEKEGIALSPERGPDGWRRYGDADLAWLSGVLMLRGTGMTIGEIRAYAQRYRAGATRSELLGLLLEHREAVTERMAEVQRHLTALDAKIAWYRADPGRTRGDEPSAADVVSQGHGSRKTRWRVTRALGDESASPTE
ncbi:MerR family transcriptional regulator [Aeromicrobium sp.]